MSVKQLHHYSVLLWRQIRCMQDTANFILVGTFPCMSMTCQWWSPPFWLDDFHFQRSKDKSFVEWRQRSTRAKPMKDEVIPPITWRWRVDTSCSLPTKLSANHKETCCNLFSWLQMLANSTSLKIFLIGQRSDFPKRPRSLCLWFGSMPSLSLSLHLFSKSWSLKSLQQLVISYVI